MFFAQADIAKQNHSFRWRQYGRHGPNSSAYRSAVPCPFVQEPNLDRGIVLQVPATARSLWLYNACVTSNEGRALLNYPPAEGGDTPYLQQQNYSLAALNKRDQKDDPFGKGAATTVPAPVPQPPALAKPTPGGRQLLVHALAAKRLARIETSACHS